MTSPKPYQFKVWDAWEFANREFPEPEWLIPNIVPGAGNNMIYAHGKIGKSILTIQLVHALIHGTPFLGTKPTQKFKVLWVQTDLPEREWALQMKLLSNAPDGIPWVKGCRMIWEPKGMFAHANRVTALTKLFKEEGFEFLVLDSIMSLIGDTDINNPVAARKVFEKIEGIVGPKPTWSIHHTRKGMPGVPDHVSTAGTGSGQITAGASTLFYLRDKSLEIRGRFVEKNMKLTRGEHGLWIPVEQAKKEKNPYQTKPTPAPVPDSTPEIPGEVPSSDEW